MFVRAHEPRNTIRLITASWRRERCNVSVPLLRLGSSGDAESCTYVPRSPQQCSRSRRHSRPVQAAKPTAFIRQPFGSWYLGFWLTYRSAYRYRFSRPRAPSPSRERVAHRRERSASVFAGLTDTVNYRRGVTGKSDSDKRLCSGDTHGAASCALAFSLLPSFPASGTRVHPDSSSLTANAALCHGVH